ncbi:MFS transporter [Mitsuokella sp. WILCCON 0060]|uniref:MFS transporter n=1 Tax=unclassified Mitsuokella TaxID=2637239 RepID=UPI003F03E46B
MSQKVVISIKRLVPGLIIGPASWLGPYIVMLSLFLPALLQEIDPANKVAMLALFAASGSIISAISNMVAGALSDSTHSRFGKRAPWIVGGAFVFMLSMIGAGFSEGVTMLLVCWLIGQVALNFIVAPMVAWLDFAEDKYKGTASSAYGGLGMALGNNGFNVIGAMFLGQFRLGFVIFGVITFVGVLIATLIVHEPSNLNEKDDDSKKKEHYSLSMSTLRQVFPAWHIGRDYYLALIGKILLGVANFAITGYILYIMTDFLKLSGDMTQTSIQLINSIMFFIGVFMGFFAGPFADKFKILKLPIGFSALFLAAGALALFVLRDMTGITVYAFCAGIGMGLWNSLDNYLNLKVIPDKDRVGFFLGVYNVGNSLPQAIGPVIAATAIGLIGFSGVFVISMVFALVASLCIFAIRGVAR